MKVFDFGSHISDLYCSKHENLRDSHIPFLRLKLSLCGMWIQCYALALFQIHIPELYSNHLSITKIMFDADREDLVSSLL